MDETDKAEKYGAIEVPEKAKKIPYPKSIFFIFSNEFCERFSYYGMRTILALYLQGPLGYSEDASTVLYHVFVMLCYFTPLIGGVMADSWLGKYKTILYVSILYSVGNIALSIGSLPQDGIPHAILSMAGLLLIASGTGGIKPCVSSFGGDQFVLPQQEKQLEHYFSVFYFSINAGSVLSCFFTPVLREVKCLGQDSCYSLAFGVPAVLMILSIVFFVLGKRMYKIVEPDGKNIPWEVVKCSTHALGRKIRMSKKLKKSHWLDYADDKYDLTLIEDSKVLMKLIVLFTPTILFWSLYEQQGSRWTFQASHMDGRLGTWWVIPPDQMQTFNAVLVLAFIPVFDSLVYPLCAKIRLITTPLQKLSWGGFIGALAFVFAAVVQLFMQASYPVFPAAGEAQLRLYNGIRCDLALEGLAGRPTLAALADLRFNHLPVDGSSTELRLTAHPDHCPSLNNSSQTLNVQLNNAKASSYFMYPAADSIEMFPMELKGYKELDKLESANVKLKIIYDSKEELKVKLYSAGQSETFKLLPTDHQTVWNDTLSPAVYQIRVKQGSGEEELGELDLAPGGVYTLMLSHNSTWGYSLFEVTPPNNISMLWQIPQYVAITFAEILFSITGMEFAFTQSPESMKSVISSLWLVTDALGNMVVLLIAGLQIFENQAYEFFLFAGMMAAVMVVFVALAVQYKYVSYSSGQQVNDLQPPIQQSEP